MYSRRGVAVSAFLSLLILCCVPAFSQGGQVARLNVSPDFIFFTQTGSTAPAPVQVKISAISSSVTSGKLGAFTAKASTLSGGSWLSVTPTAGTGASTLTVSATTTGLAAGEYSGTVTITAAGFANSPYNLGVSLTILAPAMTVQPSSLNFSTVSGGATPPAQTLLVSLMGGGSFSWTATATVTTPSGGKWLKIPSVSTSSAGTLSVSVDPTGLAAGTYQGQIQVTGSVNGTTSTIKVPVTLNVTAPKPPALQLNPSTINIVYNPLLAAPLVLPVIQVTNSGSGTINWAAKVAVDSPAGGNWLSVGPTTGSTPGTISVLTSPTGLKAGTYSATITVSSVGTTASNSLSAQARVFFTIVGLPTPVVSVTPPAVAFQFADGVLTPQSAPVSVTSTSSGLSFTASATTAKGGNWLTVSPASGAVSSSSSVTVGVSSSVAASLSAGIYTGTVTIKVPGASKGTFTVLASLQVFPSGQTPFFELEPGALLFAGQPGATNPAAQSVNLLVVGSTSLAWSTTVATHSGASWLSVSPASGAGSGAIKVSVDDSKLAAGVYSGSVTFNAAANTAVKPVTLQVMMYVGGLRPVLGPRDVTPGATATESQALFTMPAQGFTRSESLPINVSVMLVDSNGSAIDDAVVTVKSSNGEPDLTLDSAGGGVYSALFQPLGSGPLVLTATAESSATAAVSGDVAPSSDTAPVIYQGGVVNAASFEASAPVAPGSLVSLFGRDLTAEGGNSTSVPLPFLLGDVSVSVGGFPAALVMADPAGGQINLQVPFEVQGEQADVVVNSGGRLSAPITVQLSPAAPALFTLSQDGAGPAAALRADYSAVNAASPAAAGDEILLYATGLGALRSPVADGAASPGGIAASGVVTVTIGGVNAEVDYAGSAPGFPGLYQINVRVPAGLASGDAAVVVSASGVGSAPGATVSIR